MALGAHGSDVRSPTRWRWSRQKPRPLRGLRWRSSWRRPLHQRSAPHRADHRGKWAAPASLLTGCQARTDDEGGRRSSPGALDQVRETYRSGQRRVWWSRARRRSGRLWRRTWERQDGRL